MGVAAELAAALCQSPIGAARRVDTALDLVDELPATLLALREGRVDRARAALIADRTLNLGIDLRGKVEAASVPLAHGRTPGQLRPMIDRRVLGVDPNAARKRHVRARAERGVEHHADTDGMGVIKATLPAEDALSVKQLLDDLAQATAGHDDRPIAARRADALTDICVQLLTDGYVDITTLTGGRSVSREDSTSTQDAAGPVQTGARRRGRTHHGRASHLNVTISAAALAALTDQPGELAGHGAITAQLARALACSARSLTAIVINPHGHATAIGATTYLPRQTTRDHVLLAAGTCTHSPPVGNPLICATWITAIRSTIVIPPPEGRLPLRICIRCAGTITC